MLKVNQANPSSDNNSSTRLSDLINNFQIIIKKLNALYKKIINISPMLTRKPTWETVKESKQLIQEHSQLIMQYQQALDKLPDSYQHIFEQTNEPLLINLNTKLQAFSAHVSEIAKKLLLDEERAVNTKRKSKKKHRKSTHPRAQLDSDNSLPTDSYAEITSALTPNIELLPITTNVSEQNHTINFLFNKSNRSNTTIEFPLSLAQSEAAKTLKKTSSLPQASVVNPPENDQSKFNIEFTKELKAMAETVTRITELKNNMAVEYKCLLSSLDTIEPSTAEDEITILSLIDRFNKKGKEVSDNLFCLRQLVRLIEINAKENRNALPKIHSTVKLKL